MFVWAKINSPDTSSMEFVDNFSTIKKFSLLQDQFLEQMVKVTLGFRFV